MKKYFYVIFTFFIGVMFFYSLKVEAVMPLTGKTIVIDPGHGLEDPGTSYGNILEKDINLKISKYLYEELGAMGANVIMTRDGDYDLSRPNANYRKKSDFDNRIKLINESNADMYVSIHLNYLSDSKYSGAQVFYTKDNEELAKVIQSSLNEETKSDRKSKPMPKDTYMYSKLKVKGVLIECGFLSNKKERELLTTSEYQQKLAKIIAEGLVKAI